METLGSAPPVATSVSYEYRNRTGGISSILRLSDVSRTLNITGRSRDQVEAAASVASSIISQSQTTVGGSFQRSILKAVLLSVGIILVWMPGKFAFRLIWGALQLVGFVLALSVWVLPWEDWFPGSAVYRGDASFFVRHAALISFLGFLATIATLVWGIVRSLGGTRFLKAEVAPTATEGD